jgi:ribosome-associated protein
MEEPSKTQAKRDAADLKDLGDALVALPATELEALPLPEKLRDAIELAGRISAHGARDRQRQFIGKLLRNTDVAAIRATIARRALERRIAAQGFHRIEAWRDRLLAEGEPAIAALLDSAPALDAASLEKLLATARADLSAGRGVAASRALFRWLRDALAAADPSG